MHWRRIQNKENCSTFIQSCPRITSLIALPKWTRLGPNCCLLCEKQAPSRLYTGTPQQGKRLILFHGNISAHMTIENLDIKSGFLSYKLQLQIHLPLPHQYDDVPTHKAYRYTLMVASVKTMIHIRRKCRVVPATKSFINLKSEHN